MQALASKSVVVQEIRPFSRLFDTTALAKKVPKTSNEIKLKHGIEIRNQVLPQNISEQTNKIGLFSHPQKNTIGQYNEKRLTTVDDHFGRVVRIYKQATNHMHDTPVQPKGDKWCLELERQAVWKNNHMGWTYNNDSLSKRNVFFPTLDHAIQYCNYQGLGYHIEYPKTRVEKKKAYADNFQWPGHDEDVDTDC